MILNMKRARPNNKMLVSRDWNYNGMTANNTSGCAPH